jgi:lipopolysaccharide heptosyltransferase II
MKILQILPELNVGGVETGTVDFASYLVNSGHEALVVSNGGKLVEQLEKSGARHLQLPVHQKSLWTILRMVKVLRRIIQDEKVDIVHARSRVPAWIAFLACRKTNAAFITTCHGYYKNKLFSQVMGWGKLVIVPSEAIGRHMIHDYKVPPENIRCIPRSVNLERFNVTKETKTAAKDLVVTIVGRITPLKGHDYFLKAMAKAIRSMPQIKVWIVGDAPKHKMHYKEELEVLAQHLGIRDKVEFLGNRQDVPQLLSQTDVLVLSTVTQEAFGRVILEAQAIGVPVVATKVGGVVDIIDDGETGLLVMPKDVDSMAREVLRLLSDKTLAQNIVEKARVKLKSKFTLEHMASKTIRVYEELLDLMHILVIKIGAIGDVVLVTGSLKALREKFSNAKIYCLVGKESRKVLQNCPYLDGLIIYDPQHKDRGWWRLLKFAKKLRRYQFDKVVDFQNNRVSHLLSFLSFPRESYGYNNRKWGFLISRPVSNPQWDIAPVPHQFQILSMLDIEYSPRVFLELWPSSKDREYIAELLESEWMANSKIIVGINVAASAKWPTKNWPLEYIAKLCDVLSSKNIRVVLTGMDKDRPLISQLVSLTKSKPAVLAGKTDILQLAALMERCKVFITPDSAPLHVAAAMKTPVIAFFGPTDSKRHQPPARNIKILEKKLSCQPCYSSRCKVQTHACMKEITPDEVLKEIYAMVGSKP